LPSSLSTTSDKARFNQARESIKLVGENVETFYITHPPERQQSKEKQVMALGFFDGVHYGHQKVIRTAKMLAEEKGIKSAVMTFHPHPSVVLNKNKKDIAYITPLSEKIEMLRRLEIDYCYVVKFTPEFASLTPQEFVDQYIIAFNVKHIVAGFDFTYGSLGRGTMETMPFHSREQFDQTTVGKVEKDEQKISSTLIRQLIVEGNVERIPSYLGRLYEVSGTVVEGEKRGRKIGFPTANINVDAQFLLPKPGVYCVKVNIDGQLINGVCNIGNKPTFHNDFELTVEVHLLAFNSNIYGKKVSVQWLQRLRDEKKFKSVNELIAQIQHDKNKALEYFALS
jgi:riboflavin kinase / FMN adenylyltransferase